MEDLQSSKQKRGNLILENRQILTVSGIKDVESFTSDKVVLITNEGSLFVNGSNLHIKKLSTESGEAIVEGEINGCVYSDGIVEKEGFFKRVLK